MQARPSMRACETTLFLIAICEPWSYAYSRFASVAILSYLNRDPKKTGQSGGATAENPKNSTFGIRVASPGGHGHSGISKT
jgi:hypothetical protein